MKRLLLPLMSLALPAGAAAAPGMVAAQAVVEWKHEAQPHIIVDESVWRCDGGTCTGGVVDKPLLKLRACRAIARYAGRVTSFSTASGPLGTEEIARCNGGR